MSNVQQQNNAVQPLKALLQSTGIQSRIEAMIGRKADSYITSCFR